MEEFQFIIRLTRSFIEYFRNCLLSEKATPSIDIYFNEYYLFDADWDWMTSANCFSNFRMASDFSLMIIW